MEFNPAAVKRKSTAPGNSSLCEEYGCVISSLPTMPAAVDDGLTFKKLSSFFFPAVSGSAFSPSHQFQMQLPANRLRGARQRSERNRIVFRIEKPVELRTTGLNSLCHLDL